MNTCKMRFDVALSTKYPTGGGSQQFKIVVGIEIAQGNAGELTWRQVDTPDYRMPAQGFCEKQNGGLALYHKNPKTSVKEKIASLGNFTLPPSSGQTGLIEFDYISPPDYKNSSQKINWKGKGKWTLINNSWVEGRSAWGGMTGVTTNWTFKTSQGASGGAGKFWTLNASGGDIVITNKTDPAKRDYKLMYGGLGGGVSLPSSGFGGGLSGSTFDFPSGAVTDIYYGNINRSIPMPIQEFVGHATFLEITGTLVWKYLPKMGKFPGFNLPAGVTGSITATIIWFYVPYVIGVLPVTWGAWGIMWGVSLGAGTSAGGSATLFHGYVSTP